MIVPGDRSFDIIDRPVAGHTQIGTRRDFCNQDIFICPGVDIRYASKKVAVPAKIRADVWQCVLGFGLPADPYPDRNCDHAPGKPRYRNPIAKLTHLADPPTRSAISRVFVLAVIANLRGILDFVETFWTAHSVPFLPRNITYSATYVPECRPASHSRLQNRGRGMSKCGRGCTACDITCAMRLGMADSYNTELRQRLRERPYPNDPAHPEWRDLRRSFEARRRRNEQLLEARLRSIGLPVRRVQRLPEG